MYCYTHVQTHYTHILGQASVITDIVVLYVLKRRHYYHEKKYDHATDPKKAYAYRLSSSEDDSKLKSSYVGILDDNHVV